MLSARVNVRFLPHVLNENNRSDEARKERPDDGGGLDSRRTDDATTRFETPPSTTQASYIHQLGGDVVLKSID